MLNMNDVRTSADRLHEVDVLLGKKMPAERVLKGGNVVNVITGEIYQADVAIEGKHILMVGDCSELIGEKTDVVDCTGKYITPGFIDAHMHFESAMLTVTEFSRLSLPTGTTCLISDPHEIGNVLGPVGIRAMARLAKASVSRIVIERTLKLVTITVCTARPGIIIGKGGSEVDKLKEELKKITDKDIQINIFEVKRPELDAVIVANNIARQVEGKIAYRRAIKMAIANTMRMGAEGIKVLISGRLNGAEMARSEMYKEGRTPLHTFRADIDYCHAEALTKVGLLGIKVWICRGEVFGKRELAPNFTQTKESGRGNSNNGGKNFRKKKNNNR